MFLTCGESLFPSFYPIDYRPDQLVITEDLPITNDNLITWLKAALGSDQVTALETGIATQITESKAPSSFSGVPS